MDAFEAIVASLLRREGYWIAPRYKLLLTPEEKREIGMPTCPRWEFDILAYKAATNEVLVVECKSFMYSKGVRMAGGKLQRESTYKMFNDPALCKTLLALLTRDLLDRHMCRAKPTIQLALAAGKIAESSRRSLERHFRQNGWKLLDDHWIGERLIAISKDGYQDDTTTLATKLAISHYQSRRDRFVSDGSDVDLLRADKN